MIDIALGLVNKEFLIYLKRRQVMSYTQETAETLALKILTWLAGNEDLLPIFQGSTGVSNDDLRVGASDPVLLGSVLDFVMMDDVWVVQACDANALAYDSLYRARQALPGGEQVNWT